MALKSPYRAKLKNWTLFSVASVLEVNKNSIVFRLARHLCSSTPLVYLFIYMFGRMYVILYFDPPYFCVRSAFDPVPNFTKQNPLVLRPLPVSP